jgi:integrase
MPTITFTDLNIQRLKGDTSYTTYFDKALPSFGVRCGIKSKTFILIRGKDRRRISLGKYPTISLKKARSAALAIIDGTSLVQASQEPLGRMEEYLRQLDASDRYKYEQQRLLRRYLLPNVNDLSKVTKQELLRVTDKLTGTSSEHLHCLRTFRAFFNWLVSRDYIAASPMNGISFPTDKERSRILTDDELRHIWNKSIELGAYGLVIKLCILLGTRKGETSAIKEDWIGDNNLTIPKEFTKNGREHILPLTEAARAYAMQLATSPKPNWNSWNKIKKQAQFDGFTIHDIRRTFATTLAAIGIEPHIIERLINHASGQISGVAAIYNRYHYLPQMREALEKYEAHLEAHQVFG